MRILTRMHTCTHTLAHSRNNKHTHTHTPQKVWFMYIRACAYSYVYVYACVHAYEASLNGASLFIFSRHHDSRIL